MSAVRFYPGSLDGNQAKRSRLTNGSSDAAENLVGRQLPAGAQDPFIRRPTSNTGLRTRSSSRRSVAGRGSMITQEPVSGCFLYATTNKGYELK